MVKDMGGRWAGGKVEHQKFQHAEFDISVRHPGGAVAECCVY